MQVLNFGSLNIDYVYRQPHIVRAGETLSSYSMTVHAGGKGANQSAALGRAAVAVRHAGRIAQDGQFLLDILQSAQVDISLIDNKAETSGHAIIQVDDQGENSIILFGGANQEQSDNYVDSVISQFNADDILLLQNEINNMPRIMQRAHEQGMRIYFNPAPYTEVINEYPLDLVDCFVLNETEAAGMTAVEETSQQAQALLEKFPNASFLLTLGGDGVRYIDQDQDIVVSAFSVDVVDTTAAGDTFIGYFLASIIDGLDIEPALRRACAAAALAVSKEGAMDSVPSPDAVAAFLREHAI